MAPRVVVTRPRASAATLYTRLRSVGAHPLSFPTIRIAPVDPPAVLDRALRDPAAYAWIVFTSTNAVAFFSRRMRELGRSPNELGGARIAAVGSHTAEALMRVGLPPAFVPNDFRAEALASELEGVRDRRVLFPCGRIASDTLPSLLRSRGAHVDEAVLYDTVPATPTAEERRALETGFDAALFTSGSAARNLAALADDALLGRFARATIGCIGPTTAAAVREIGLPVHVVPETHTTEALVASLAERLDLPAS